MSFRQNVTGRLGQLRMRLGGELPPLLARLEVERPKPLQIGIGQELLALLPEPVTDADRRLVKTLLRMLTRAATATRSH